MSSEVLLVHIFLCCKLSCIYIFAQIIPEIVQSVYRLATDWTTKGRSSSPGRGKNFLFSMSSRWVLGPTQPAIQWVLVALSLGVKLLDREADHSSPTSAEVKKAWVYTLWEHLLLTLFYLFTCSFFCLYFSKLK
jgi:hypothetical protein